MSDSDSKVLMYYNKRFQFHSDINEEPKRVLKRSMP